jgi:hypothetical protein
MVAGTGKPCPFGKLVLEHLHQALKLRLDRMDKNSLNLNMKLKLGFTQDFPSLCKDIDRFYAYERGLQMHSPKC